MAKALWGAEKAQSRDRRSLRRLYQNFLIDLLVTTCSFRLPAWRRPCALATGGVVRASAGRFRTLGAQMSKAGIAVLVLVALVVVAVVVYVVVLVSENPTY